MKTTKKKDYEAPQLMVVTFKTEVGFVQSPPMLGLSEQFGNETLEERDEGGNWGNTSEWF